MTMLNERRKNFALQFNIWSELKDYVFITLGLVMYAVGVNMFQLPYQITTGGVTGIGIVTFYATGFPYAYTYFIINLVLLGIAIKELGWKFSIKTIYAVVMLTFFLESMRHVLMAYGAAHPGEFVISPNGLPQIVKDDIFMSTIIGASLQGIALGIVFLNNGSTGGLDIVAAIINKYKDVTLGQVIMILDFMVVSSNIFLPGFNFSNLLYGYCALIVLNLLLDFVVDRGRQSVQFFIFSQQYNLIADAITSTGRGVTILDGEGWYTRTERKVLVVLAKKAESGMIFRLIHQIDPDAFVSQSKVIGVFGEGFERMKIKKQKNAVEKSIETTNETLSSGVEKNEV